MGNYIKLNNAIMMNVKSLIMNLSSLLKHG